MHLHLRQHRASVGRPRLRRRLLVGLAALTMLGGSAMALSTNTASTVAGLQVAQFTPLRTSQSPKIATVQCPGGTAGLGGDVEVIGSTQVRINAIVPTPTNVSFLLTAPAGVAVGTWTFTARAFCAPSSSLPGLEYRMATRRELSSVRNGPKAARVDAACSGSKQVIGQGGSVERDPTSDEPDPSQFLFLTDMGAGGTVGFPGTRVRAGGATRGFDGQWTVRSRCASVPASRACEPNRRSRPEPATLTSWPRGPAFRAAWCTAQDSSSTRSVTSARWARSTYRRSSRGGRASRDDST